MISFSCLRFTFEGCMTQWLKTFFYSFSDFCKPQRRHPNHYRVTNERSTSSVAVKTTVVPRKRPPVFPQRRDTAHTILKIGTRTKLTLHTIIVNNQSEFHHFNWLKIEHLEQEFALPNSIMKIVKKHNFRTVKIHKLAGSKWSRFPLLTWRMTYGW